MRNELILSKVVVSYTYDFLRSGDYKKFNFSKAFGERLVEENISEDSYF